MVKVSMLAGAGTNTPQTQIEEPDYGLEHEQERGAQAAGRPAQASAVHPLGRGALTVHPVLAELLCRLNPLAAGGLHCLFITG